MISLRNVATFLNLLVLFFLVVGRLENESLGLKIGGKTENLFPLLLAAWFLTRKSRSVSMAQILSPFLAGMLLVGVALIAGFIQAPSYEALDELFRFCLQVCSGILLGSWLCENLKINSWWSYVWIAGLIILQVGTPWDTLSQPEMEGSFGHRNLQSAFYLLSFPMLAFILQSHSGSSRRERMMQALVVLLLLSEICFIRLSKSRSGLVGACAALLIWLAINGWLKTPRLPRTWIGIAMTAAVFITLLAVSPRFLSLGREISNPYYLTRAGVWSAAVEGLQKPSRWLSGTGMGTGYFWTIQESPMGNLSYRYRRGHHPHCLYLQWIYWGGISALIGWLFVIGAIGYLTLRKTLSWEACLLGACLLGYACLELFETAMKNPRIHALFWLDLTLLGGMVWQQRKEMTERNAWDHSSGWGIPMVTVLLPLAWFKVFSLPQLLSLVFILVVITVLQRPRFRAWITTSPAGDLNLPQWRCVTPILITLFLTGLYLPLLETLRIPPVLILSLLALSICGLLLDRFSVLRPVFGGTSGTVLLSTQERFPMLLMGVAMGVPLLLGGFVMASFAIVGGHLPSEFKPRQGLYSVLWLTLLWWLIWCKLAAKPTGRSSIGRPISIQLAAAILIILSGLWGICFLGTGWSYLTSDKDNMAVADWDRLIVKCQNLGFPPLERVIRTKAMKTARSASDQNTWIHWAKDADLTTIAKDSPPSLLADVLANGGKFMGKEEALQQKATGLAITTDLNALWILFDRGRLLKITDQTQTYTLDSGPSSFTHCRLDPQGCPLILRADGELLRLAESPVVLSPPPDQNTEPRFRRLCVDPRNGEIWSLDLYGHLYRLDPNTGWVQDSRFLEVSRQGGLEVDIARDIAISRDGTLALLDCYGQIWLSPPASNGLKGPLNKTHYWPTLPLGQSLQALEKGFILSDRYGGLYLSPYPEDPDLLRLRGSYLFPRSLPREQPDIVDQAFLPAQRWVYLLTGSGRILTNHRWGDVWAE